METPFKHFFNDRIHAGTLDELTRFRTEVDLIPDQQNKVLTVRLHPMTTQAHDEILRHICAELTATETVFPGTDLRLIYEISGSC